MKVDDWVQLKDTGEVGVVVSIGELIVVRVPRENNPFPKNVAVSASQVKRYRPQRTTKEEKALL
jgi:hypothetical protein